MENPSREQQQSKLKRIGWVYGYFCFFCILLVCIPVTIVLSLIPLYLSKSSNSQPVPIFTGTFDLIFINHNKAAAEPLFTNYNSAARQLEIITGDVPTGTFEITSATHKTLNGRNSRRSERDIQCGSINFLDGSQITLWFTIHYPKRYACRVMKCYNRFYNDVIGRLKAKSPFQLIADNGQRYTMHICQIYISPWNPDSTNAYSTTTSTTSHGTSTSSYHSDASTTTSTSSGTSTATTITQSTTQPNNHSTTVTTGQSSASTSTTSQTSASTGTTGQTSASTGTTGQTSASTGTTGQTGASTGTTGQTGASTGTNAPVVFTTVISGQSYASTITNPPTTDEAETTTDESETTSGDLDEDYTTMSSGFT